jgi:hypothetical protein
LNYFDLAQFDSLTFGVALKRLGAERALSLALERKAGVQFGQRLGKIFFGDDQFHESPLRKQEKQGAGFEW